MIDIVKDGDHTVTFKLAGGNADLPWLMTDYHLAICPANDDGTIDWQSGDGTGPYKIDEGQMGVRFALSPSRRLARRRCLFRRGRVSSPSNDPNARQTALVTGDVDAVSASRPEDDGAAGARSRTSRSINVPSGATITMPMLTATPRPFDNADVRNALKLAMNRDEIIEKIAFGAATKGNDFHHSPAHALLAR